MVADEPYVLVGSKDLEVWRMRYFVRYMCSRCLESREKGIWGAPPRDKNARCGAPVVESNVGRPDTL